LPSFESHSIRSCLLSGWGCLHLDVLPYPSGHALLFSIYDVKSFMHSIHQRSEVEPVLLMLLTIPVIK
jgi:hypothetical protein